MSFCGAYVILNSFQTQSHTRPEEGVWGVLVQGPHSPTLSHTARRRQLVLGVRSRVAMFTGRR